MVDEQARVVLNRRVLLNTISNYAGKTTNLIAWFFLTPFILNQLGPAIYGLWVLVGSLVAYGSLLDFGIAGAVTKYVAEFRVKGEKEHLQSLIATALWIYTGIGFIIIVLSLAAAPVFPALFNIAPEHHQTAYWLVLLSGLGIGISIPATTAPAFLRGLQRFDLLNLTTILHTVIQTGATVAVLLLGGGAVGVVAVSISVKLLMLIPMILMIKRIAPEIKFGWRGASRPLVRKVASFSSSIFLIHLGGHLETKTDEVVIGAFMPLIAVTPYNLARRLSSLPQTLAEQFLSQLLPLASQIHAENDPNRLRSLFVVSTRLTIALFLPFACILMILARPILGLWVGESYGDYAPLVIILTLASLIDMSIWPAGSILQGIARHRVPSILALVSGLFNLILSIILVRRIGLTGVALGTLIPTTIICLGFILPYTMRLIGVDLRRIILEVALPALLPAAPSAIAVYLLYQMMQMPTFFGLAFIAAAGLITYFVGYLSLGVNRFEREAFRGLLHNLVRFARAYPRSS